MPIVLICGGRKFKNYLHMCRTLDRAVLRLNLPSDTEFLHGDALGADTLAGMWALCRGYKISAYAADWDQFGTNAGPIRNQAMADRRPTYCIAFPGGAGTADMARRAKLAGATIIKG